MADSHKQQKPKKTAKKIAVLMSAPVSQFPKPEREHRLKAIHSIEPSCDPFTIG
jgi:hypothetical protein